jgi:hypothetical protein
MKIPLKNSAGYFFCFEVLILISGCSQKKKPDGLPELYPLTITITQNGNTPLAGASVRLISTDKQGTPRWNVSGITDNSGTAKIQTYGEFKGAPVGNYKIVISKEELVYDTSTPPKITERFHLVESKYTNVQQTPLSIDVKPDTGKATFDVGKSVREKIKLPR